MQKTSIVRHPCIDSLIKLQIASSELPRYKLQQKGDADQYKHNQTHTHKAVAFSPDSQKHADGRGLLCVQVEK